METASLDRLGAWCPICGAQLDVDIQEGKRVLRCPKHGPMNCYLGHDPLANSEAI